MIKERMQSTLLSSAVKGGILLFHTKKERSLENSELKNLVGSLK